MAADLVGPGDVAPISTKRTGQVNSMGMPIVATPGSGSGVADGDGVTGTPALWALGRVPLDVAVRRRIRIGPGPLGHRRLPELTADNVTGAQRCSPSRWWKRPRHVEGHVRKPRRVHAESIRPPRTRRTMVPVKKDNLNPRTRHRCHDCSCWVHRERSAVEIGGQKMRVNITPQMVHTMNTSTRRVPHYRVTPSRIRPDHDTR